MQDLLQKLNNIEDDITPVWNGIVMMILGVWEEVNDVTRSCKRSAVTQSRDALIIKQFRET
jgi:hypothetical protein